MNEHQESTSVSEPTKDPGGSAPQKGESGVVDYAGPPRRRGPATSVRYLVAAIVAGACFLVLTLVSDTMFQNAASHEEQVLAIDLGLLAYLLLLIAGVCAVVALVTGLVPGRGGLKAPESKPSRWGRMSVGASIVLLLGVIWIGGRVFLGLARFAASMLFR